MGTKTQEYPPNNRRAGRTQNPDWQTKNSAVFLRVLIKWGFTFKELEFIICNDAKSIINNHGQPRDR